MSVGEQISKGGGNLIEIHYCIKGFAIMEFFSLEEGNVDIQSTLVTSNCSCVELSGQ